MRCVRWALLTWWQQRLISKNHEALTASVNVSSRYHILGLTSLLLRVSLLSWKHVAGSRRKMRSMTAQKRFLLERRTSKIALDALHEQCCRVRHLFLSGSRLARRKSRSVTRMVLHEWHRCLHEAREAHDHQRRGERATLLELQKRTRRLGQRCIYEWAGIVSDRSWHQRICTIYTSKLLKTHIQHLLVQWRDDTSAKLWQQRICSVYSSKLLKTHLQHLLAQWRDLTHARLQSQQRAVTRTAQFWSMILALELDLRSFFMSWRYLQTTKSRQHKLVSHFMDRVCGHHSRQLLHDSFESWTSHLETEKARQVRAGRQNVRLSWLQLRVLRFGFRQIFDEWKTVHAARRHKSFKHRLVAKSVRSRYGLLIQRRHDACLMFVCRCLMYACFDDHMRCLTNSLQHLQMSDFMV